MPRRDVIVLLFLAVSGVCSNSLPIQGQSSESHEMERVKKLDSIIGKPIFACSGAAFLHYELVDPPSHEPGAKNIRWGDQALAFPLLTPLIIRKAVVSGKVDNNYTIALIVEFWKDKSAATIVLLRAGEQTLEGDALLEQMIGDFKGKLFTKVPADFSKDSVDSIQYRLVTEGMSQSEVICSKGFPEERNDYGKAGEQWVYGHGKLLIYFGHESGKVQDMQTFE